MYHVLQFLLPNHDISVRIIVPVVARSRGLLGRIVIPNRRCEMVIPCTYMNFVPIGRISVVVNFCEVTAFIKCRGTDFCHTVRYNDGGQFGAPHKCRGTDAGYFI